jgi:hypothetical protein
VAHVHGIRIGLGLFTLHAIRSWCMLFCMCFWLCGSCENMYGFVGFSSYVRAARMQLLEGSTKVGTCEGST